MALLIEGIGDDWVVLRRSGSRPELVWFKDIDGLRRAVRRALTKVESSSNPVHRAPVPRPAPQPDSRPTARPRDLPVATPPPPADRPPAFQRAKEGPNSPPPTTSGTTVRAEDLDCMACGACCAPQDQRKDTHPALDADDVAQLPTMLQKTLIVNDGGKRFIRTKKSGGVTVCAALKGNVGGRCKCGIYERRPMVCRIFEKGSEECLAARAAFGV